jgi:hypothetical protein
VGVTPVCETADAHKLPHVLGWVATTILVHMGLCRSFILPHLSCRSSYGSTVLMFAEQHLGYCDCPALQLLLCTEPELFVADCRCASVRFSSFLAEARPVL